jgi:hypothetical protein
LTPKTYHKEIQNQKWEEKKQIKRKSILNSFLKKGRKGRKYHISVFTGHNQWLFPRPKLLNFSLALPVGAPELKCNGQSDAQTFKARLCPGYENTMKI